jgi:hypothetical protein
MPYLSRRTFVQGVAGTALLWGGARWSSARPASVGAVLSGTEFDLSIDKLPVNFTGRARYATVVNGQLPAPLLRSGARVGGRRRPGIVAVRIRHRGHALCGG